MDVEGTIRVWESRQMSTKYDYLLYLLLGATSRTPALLLDEVTRILQLRASQPVLNTTGCLHLANRLASAATVPAPAEIAVAVAAAIDLLKRHTQACERDLPPRAKIEINIALSRFDPANIAVYRARKLSAELLNLQTGFQELLEGHVKRGQLFLMFFHYVFELKYWGLEIDISPEEMELRLRAGGQERKRAVDEFRESGRAVPEPFVGAGPGRRVSSDLLWHGWCLFEPPCESEPILDDLRAEFNSAGRKGMTELYRQLAESTAIPPQISSIIREHQQRMIKYTVPR